MKRTKRLNNLFDKVHDNIQFVEKAENAINAAVKKRGNSNELVILLLEMKRRIDNLEKKTVRRLTKTEFSNTTY